MAKATPKIEIGTMFDKNRSLHIERIQFGKKSPKYWITVEYWRRSGLLPLKLIQRTTVDVNTNVHTKH